MDHGLKDTLAALNAVWNIKLITIADIKLSLGNVIVALVMLLLAARISRLVVRLINKRLIVPFVHDRSTQVTYQTFAYYGTLAAFVCLALTIAGIPLTVFTVVGGALAIGVGFGSQNIVNNFISGVILLIEQPIRVGDWVDVDGFSGTVSSINTRSTKLKNIDGKTFIIPNSFFLEKAVLNNTFSASALRATVDFGVAYGSDVRLVENICMDVMLNTEGVEQTPVPLVWFMDFAESNLTFQMVFYCDVNKVSSMNQVKSDVRFKLNEKFRDMNVEMAFPQRDLNLKVKDSLNVKVLS